MLRDEEKRRNHDDKWKSDSTAGGGGGGGSGAAGGGSSGGDKLIRDRVRHTRAPPYNDHSVHDPLLNKHSLSSRLSKSSRAPSLEYVRLKNLPEPPVLSLGAKRNEKKTKEKPVDKVSFSIIFFDDFILFSCVFSSCVASSKSENRRGKAKASRKRERT